MLLPKLCLGYNFAMPEAKLSQNIFLRIFVVLTTLPFVLLAVLFLLPRPQFEIEKARPGFWEYPSIDEANFSYSILDDGRLRIHLEHPLVESVTPEMIAWWYKNLALGQATIDGISYPYYQIFHLTEHGQIHIREPATDGSAGMGIGALVYRQEIFGAFKSKGQARVLSLSSGGFVVTPVMGPLELGRVVHKFKQVEGGTLYTVDTILGSQTPVLGWFLNTYIRNKRFSEPVLKQWIRHQVEEVGSLPNYLPDLYANRQASE
jgi:hypothetical protein